MGDRAPEPDQDLPENYWESFRRSAVERWNQRHPAPPVAAEVGELVAALRTMPLGMDAVDPTRDSVILTRTADLLEQRQSAPVPVPVSERLPGVEEMTEDDEAWVECEGGSYPIADAGDYDWEPHKWILKPIDRNDIQRNRRWLPATALPLPLPHGGQ